LALAHLGVEHIAAYSLRACGRSEREFQTLQRRLVEDLVLAKVTTAETAIKLIRDVYILAHDAGFAVKAEQEGSAFAAIHGVDLNEILCIQPERQVGNDNAVTSHRDRLQIPPGPVHPHFVKARVRISQYHDGTRAIFHGPRYLGRYDAAGRLNVEIERAA
jgi:hypothetical protein